MAFAASMVATAVFVEPLLVSFVANATVLWSAECRMPGYWPRIICINTAF